MLRCSALLSSQDYFANYEQARNVTRKFEKKRVGKQKYDRLDLISDFIWMLSVDLWSVVAGIEHQLMVHIDIPPIRVSIEFLAISPDV